jgi:hypothetical protein
MEEKTESAFPIVGVIASIGMCVLVAIIVWMFWPASSQQEVMLEPETEPVIATVEPISQSIPTNLEQSVEEEILEDSQAEEPTLPNLNESDSELRSKLSEQESGEQLLSLLADAELIRKSVRAIHSLSEGWVVKEYRPIKSPGGRFNVRDTGERTIDNSKIYEISSENYQRYEPYIDTLVRVSPESAAKLYRYFYPLFQQAYEELGLKEGEFNDVLILALDQILSSPVFINETKLIQPSVMYVYAEKDVESLSSLEKLKLRIGPENTVALRTWARNFRAQVVN